MQKGIHKYFSPPDYVTRNLIGQLGNIDFAITNFNHRLHKHRLSTAMGEM